MSSCLGFGGKQGGGEELEENGKWLLRVSPRDDAKVRLSVAMIAQLCKKKNCNLMCELYGM